MKRIKELYFKYKEIIDYLFWGVCSTLVSWVSYALYEILFDSINLASVLSWVTAFIFAFFVNKLFVFNSKTWESKIAIKEFAAFLGARVFTGVLEVFGVPFLVKIGLNQVIFGVEGMLSKVLVSVIVIALNYVFSKLIVFNKKSV